LQAQYCADPNAGMCPCYQVGDELLKNKVEECGQFTVSKID